MGHVAPRDRARLMVVAAALLWSTSGFYAKAPWFDDWPEETRGVALTFWRAVFAALTVQMAAGIGDMYASSVNAPMIALSPIGAGAMGLLLSIALIRSRVEADRARHQLQAEKAAMLECVPQPLFYFERSWSLFVLRQMGHDLTVA